MISKMNITSAKYLKDGISDENSSIKATIDGQELFVPLAEGNRHYDEIMRQVEAGELTIEEAD
jgi:glutamate racemase|tara:strand:- start:92 stop:280 length:189 start_codon:yes stop_codon:yes gene_type:complete